MESAKGLNVSSRINPWILTLGLAMTCMPLAARGAAAMPQQKDRNGDKEVKVPELLPATVRSPEPVCLRPSTVVCEDFENPDKSKWNDYKDESFRVEDDAALSGKKSIRQEYDQGQTGAGWLAWHFGDHPKSGFRSDGRFEDIYFRFYHKFQADWPERFPPRFARVGSRYVPGEMLYAWEEQLLISGRLANGTPISMPHSALKAPDGSSHLGQSGFRWLDKVPLDVRFGERKGEWVMIETRVKLNTPGQNDGRITYWVNEDTVLDRSGVNLRGAYTATTINVATIEGNWNGGADRGDLKRWFDNVVISTEPVGCAVFTVAKKKLDDQSAWQLQIATAADEGAVIWDSGEIPGPGLEIDISDEKGTFAPGADRCLLPSKSTVMRARQAAAGVWSAWSEWTPMFVGKF